jgi:hypothetical protein
METSYPSLLVADFEQSYEQLRHYEEAMRKTHDTSIAGCIALITATATLISRFGPTKELIGFVTLVFALGAVALALMVMSYGQMRLYFVRVARFLNECRAEYLKEAACPVRNISGMYVDCTLPRLFDPFSSQTFHLYVLSTYFGAISACAFASLDWWLQSGSSSPQLSIALSTVVFVCCSILMSCAVLRYWHHKERNLVKVVHTLSATA